MSAFAGNKQTICPKGRNIYSYTVAEIRKSVTLTDDNCRRVICTRQR